MEKNFSLSRQRNFISGSVYLQNLTTAARIAFFSLPSHCPHIALLPESKFVINTRIKTVFQSIHFDDVKVSDDKTLSI